MKIVERTESRLVLRHRPWFLALAIWTMGLAALYAGITGHDMRDLVERLLVLVLGLGACAAAWYWFAFLRITFDRQHGTVEHRSLRPFGSRSKSLALERVQAARVEFQRSHETGGLLSRLVLDTPDGVAALEYGYGAGDRGGLATEVNAWLEESGAASGR